PRSAYTLTLRSSDCEAILQITIMPEGALLGSPKDTPTGGVELLKGSFVRQEASRSNRKGGSP
ncbi:MAG: hypothetical protein AAB393_16225, partial [Bacteroidota bacterium]